MGAQKLFHSNPWLKPEPNGSQWENLHLQSITPSRNGTLPAALRAHSSRLRNGRTQANRYVGAAEKVIDMKLSLPQQLLGAFALAAVLSRSEEHTSELQSLMRISYAVFCLKKKHKHMKQTESTYETKYQAADTTHNIDTQNKQQ